MFTRSSWYPLGADPPAANRRATPAKKLHKALVAWTSPESNTSTNSRLWWASTRCRYALSKRIFKNLQRDRRLSRAQACKLCVKALLAKSRHFKKLGEVRHAVSSLHHHLREADTFPLHQRWTRRRKLRRGTEKRSRSLSRPSSSSVVRSAQGDTSRPEYASSRCARTPLRIGRTCARPRSTGSRKRTRHSYSASQPSNRPAPTARQHLLPLTLLMLPDLSQRQLRSSCRARAGQLYARKRRSWRKSYDRRKSECCACDKSSPRKRPSFARRSRRSSASKSRFTITGRCA